MTKVKVRSTVFYSWQSDSDNKVNRNFIQDALKKAIKQLKRNEDVLSAMRDDSSIELDKDTQGVPGSPPIVDTILKKISQAAVFVPDLTFVGQSSSGRHLPNPNVLIEYGWALKALGHGRIVPVMNTVAGEPTAETMPFDMQHLRHPITYCLSETDDLEQRKTVKAELVKKLEYSLAAVFKHMPAEDAEENVFAGQLTTFSPSAFWAQNETFPYGAQHLIIPDVPRMFLRLIPKQPLTTIETSKAVLDLITSANLKPMGSDSIGGSLYYERNSYGAFLRDEYEGSIRHCSQVFKTGEIWGLDCWVLDKKIALRHLRIPIPNSVSGVFPHSSFEDILENTLKNYLQFAHEVLHLPLPLKIIVGATDVMGFQMADNFGFNSQLNGNVVEEHLFKEIIIENYDISPRSILMPFFEYVWEECGLNRPEKESLGSWG
ncbi:MAG: hypothetical protein QTN59_16605 [Candidatus Electrothrix communis]|nr:MAG: hypothetical protein QTN59_16605 [Candidatus Electrothrix communis]